MSPKIIIMQYVIEEHSVIVYFNCKASWRQNLSSGIHSRPSPLCTESCLIVYKVYFKFPVLLPDDH